jgi:hypothetical protein
MIVLAVIGGVVVVGLAAAAFYDRWGRRRGWRVGVSGGAGFDNRTDVAARGSCAGYSTRPRPGRG